MLPLVAVLLGGIVLFQVVTVSVERPERHRVLLVAGAGAVAICAAVLAALTVLIHRPLSELRRTIARVREGDFAAAVSFADRDDEIGGLGRNFNAMVRELRDSREQIERMHQTQMSRAEHLATLGELASGLAHEIRNPLAGIAGVIDIVGHDLPESSPSREILREVQQEVLQIKRIISELLDYARPKEPVFRPADIAATAEQAVNLARHQALSRPVEIRLVKHKDVPPVEHDQAQIQQVLLNLLLNGIQAIERAGTVTLTISEQDRAALVTVADTGRGIPPDDLARVFRPFYTTKGTGTGLGLSLARHIVESHGGRIDVSSVVGEGAEFRVLLPFRRTAGDKIHAKPDAIREGPDR